MLRPRYRHLTRSYVEALGLEKFLVLPTRRVLVGYVSEHAAKPEVRAQWATCVLFEGRRYVAAIDGLSFDLDE